ncbi:hypothetical protein CXG81DRAFT_19513 [Caulochytrium protostelioides]|uniref:Conserved oligomeric Golgi complex subunit 5 n=1 Tax=Caulochytrium protostelioides TaxID=1555241 RepID=A0A4P9X6B5_9FUNG|nr:hypothetical protein CXG81DRAFT_19513 [Caulochytrium protostelioides]|eukprot:RKP00560.1 hypothetical protein CXG81DRAFT_19513 [Caulochytrium protostelioides]
MAAAAALSALDAQDAVDAVDAAAAAADSGRPGADAAHPETSIDEGAPGSPSSRWREELRDYEAYLAADFDSARMAEALLSQSEDGLVGMEGSTVLTKLGYDIEQLERQIQREVAMHHTELLSHVGHLASTHQTMLQIRTQVTKLQATQKQVALRLESGYAPRQRVLDATQAAHETLTKLNRVLTQWKRFVQQCQDTCLDPASASLAAAGSTPSDASTRQDAAAPTAIPAGDQAKLIKAASLIRDLQRWLADPDLHGIDLITHEGRPYVAETQARLVQLATGSLRHGLQELRQNDVLCAVHILHNLDLLDVVDDVAHHAVDEASELLRNALMLQGISVQELWHHVEQWTGGLMHVVARLQLIHWVLTKRKDSNGQFFAVIRDMNRQAKHAPHAGKRPGTPADPPVPAPSLDAVPSFLTQYLTQLTQAIQQDFRGLTQSRLQVLYALEAGYPRLLRQLRAIVEQRQLETHDRQMLLKSFSFLETAYLNQVMRRLTDTMQAAFPDRPGPSRFTPVLDEINKWYRVALNELEAIQFDPHMLLAVGKHVTKCLGLAHRQLQTAIAQQPRLTMPLTGLGTVSAPQQLYIDVINFTWQLIDHVYRISNTLEQDALHKQLHPACAELEAALADFVARLFGWMIAECERELFSIPEDTYAGGPAQAPSTAGDRDGAGESPFLYELGTKLRWITKEIVSGLRCGSETTAWLCSMGERLIHTFLTQISLMHPLGEKGKLRLAGDLSQVEFIFTSWFQGIGQDLARDAEATHTVLRAFKPMLFLELAQLGSLHSADAVPITLRVHHLLVRAYPAILFPTQLWNWTSIQYVEWLRTHTEGERVQLLAQCLNYYAQSVNRKSQKTFAPEYVAAHKLLREYVAAHRKPV